MTRWDVYTTGKLNYRLSRIHAKQHHRRDRTARPRSEPLIVHAFTNRSDALEKQRMLFIDVNVLVEMPVVSALVIEAPIDLIEKPGQTLVRKARYRYGGRAVTQSLNHAATPGLGGAALPVTEALMVTVDEKHFVGQELESDDLVALYLRVIPREPKSPATMRKSPSRPSLQHSSLSKPAGPLRSPVT